MFKIILNGVELIKQYNELSIAKNFAINQVVSALEREDKIIPEISIVNVKIVEKEVYSPAIIKELAKDLKDNIDSEKTEKTTIIKLAELNEDELFYVLNDLNLMDKNILKIIIEIIEKIESNKITKNVRNFLTMKFPFNFVEFINRSESYFYNEYIDNEMKFLKIEQYLDGVVLVNINGENCNLSNTYLKFLMKVNENYFKSKNITIMSIFQDYLKFNKNYKNNLDLIKSNLIQNIKKYEGLILSNELEKEYFVNSITNINNIEIEKEKILKRYTFLLELIKEENIKLKEMLNNYSHELGILNENIGEVFNYFESVMIEVNRYINIDKDLIDLKRLNTMKEDIIKNQVFHI